MSPSQNVFNLWSDFTVYNYVRQNLQVQKALEWERLQDKHEPIWCSFEDSIAEI